MAYKRSSQELVLLESSSNQFLTTSRATIYTPRVEDQNTRLSNSWQLRTAQRAMSIDNISFTPTSMHNMGLMSSISNGFHDKENNNCDDSELGSEMGKESRAESRMNNDHGSSENLKEDENIIPWRAQLRKTNSRLSLIG